MPCTLNKCLIIISLIQLFSYYSTNSSCKKKKKSLQIKFYLVEGIGKGLGHNMKPCTIRYNLDTPKAPENSDKK